MDQIGGTPISPMTNIESVYYELNTGDTEAVRVPVISNMPVKFTISSDALPVKTEITSNKSYELPGEIKEYTIDDILEGIQIEDDLHNEITKSYDKYKITAQIQDTEQKEIKMSSVKKNTINGSIALTELVESKYGLNDIFTKILNDNNERLHSAFYSTIEHVRVNLATAYYAYKAERELTHDYYVHVYDAIDKYKESGLSWGYKVTNDTNHTVDGMNLNGHVNDYIDPIAGAIDSTTIQNIFNGFGFNLSNADITGLSSTDNANIYKLLNTEYETGFAINSVTFNKPLCSQVAGSKIKKIILKLSNVDETGSGTQLSLQKYIPGQITSDAEILKTIVKNGWNTIPLNDVEFDTINIIQFGFDKNVTIHVLHIFGEQVLSSNVSEIVKKSANINKLIDKYNDDLSLTLPGHVQLNAYEQTSNDPDLIIGNNTKVTISHNGFINAPDGTLYLNAAPDINTSGGDVVLSDTSYKVINNGSLQNKGVLLNEQKIVCNSSVETYRFFAKNGFYLSSDSADVEWRNQNSINGFSEDIKPGAIEITSEKNTTDYILGLRIANTDENINEKIEINVGSNNRSSSGASAKIELNKVNQNIVLSPKVLIEPNNNIPALLHVSGNAEITETLNTKNIINTNTISSDILSVTKINIKNNNNLTVGGEDDSLSVNGINCKYINPINLGSNVQVNGALTAKVNGENNVNLGLPIGSIIMWGSPTPPNGWLICNGAEISKTTYAKLFRVIGTYYNTGNENSTVFKLPTFAMRFPMGASNIENWKCGQQFFNTNIGQSGGENEVKLTANESGLPEHTHTFQEYWTVSHNTVGSIKAVSAKNNIYDNTGHTLPAGGNDAQYAHNNIPPYVTVNFIIKYE